MSSPMQLHWTQRVALVRQNLHVACRSGDFSFFKTLQASGLMEGTNHVATLSASLGDGADAVLAAMDNLNAGVAYIHQDAFKTVYENLKQSLRGEDKQVNKSKLHVDVAMQKNVASLGIDKMTSSAIVLINQQPERVQEKAANVWICGVNITADCIEIALREMHALEDKLDDFIRLEESWNTVEASVAESIAALKGVFSFLDTSCARGDKASQRSGSIASASGVMLRRISSALIGAPPSLLHSRSPSISSNSGAFMRNGSVSSVSSQGYRTPNLVRNSISAGCPTKMPNMGHKLSTIPPTPAHEELVDPFDTSSPLAAALSALPAEAVAEPPSLVSHAVV